MRMLAVIAVALLAGCGKESPEALVASAKAYLAKNDRNAAVIQLKIALQESPDLAEARFLLGKALMETGDLAAAEKELNKAAELHYPFDQVAPARARLMVLRGDYRNALDEFAKAEVTTPQSNAELQTALGQAWMATGKPEAARAAFAAAVAAVPGYPPALLGEASVSANGGDQAGAAALVDEALAKSPSYIEGWLFKGDLAVGQGRFDDALAAYRKALEVRPGLRAANARVIAVLLRQGKLPEAANQLEAMKKVAPNHPQTLYLQALIQLRENKYAAARDAIAQQLRAAPDNPPGLILNATIEMQSGAYAQAEASLQKVLQRMPRERTARMMLVSTYLRSGQPGRALDALKPLLEGADADSDIQALAGDVFVRNGDMTQAARHFARAAALDPKDAQKRTALALSHLAVGEGELGMRELQEVAAADTGTRADLALIAAYVRERKYDAAMGAIAALEKKLPGKALPQNLRGATLLAQGDIEGARKSFERATTLDPADFTAASNLARLDLADKKPEDAKKRFEAVLAKDPKSAQALLAVADLRARAGGSTDEVAGLIDKAVAADPTSTAPRLALISYYIRVKQPKKAVEAAQDALATIPDRAELLYAAGQAQQAAGEPNQAIQSFNKLAQVRPGSPLPYVKEAGAQAANKEYDAAIANLKKALALQPDLLEAQGLLIGIYLDQNNRAAALDVAHTVQKQRPKESVGYIYEGAIYASRKEYSDAVAAYRRGLAKVATTDLALRTYSTLRAGGKPSDADKFASTWIRDHPDDRQFRNYVAETAVLRGDYAIAVQQYKAILEKKPNDPLALNNLAWVAGKLSDPRAIEYAQKADQLAPNNPAILDTLGVLLVDKGEMKRGIDVLQRATGLAPDAAGIRLNLARALVKDGQKEAARKELETLVKLGDKFANQAEVTKLMKEL